MKYQRSFTLLETIVAIYVLLAGIVGAMNLAQQNIAAITLFRHQLIASNLAQEGAEFVRSRRDSNNIACSRDDTCYDRFDLINPQNPNKEFMDGITGTGGCDTAQDCYINDFYGGLIIFSQCPVGGCPYLRLDPVTGFYQYGTGPETIFQRNIWVLQTTTLRDADFGLYDWEVHSEVTWREKLVDKSVEVVDVLTPHMAR